MKGKQEMATFTEIAKALKSRGENSRNDFQTPTRRERDEENVEETNNEQGDEGSPLSSGDGDRGNALRNSGKLKNVPERKGSTKLIFC